MLCKSSIYVCFKSSPLIAKTSFKTTYSNSYLFKMLHAAPMRFRSQPNRDADRHARTDGTTPWFFVNDFDLLRHLRKDIKSGSGEFAWCSNLVVKKNRKLLALLLMLLLLYSRFRSNVSEDAYERDEESVGRRSDDAIKGFKLSFEEEKGVKSNAKNNNQIESLFLSGRRYREYEKPRVA